MLGLSLALAAAHLNGSIVDAGLVITSHAVALATLAPLAGRLADRYGPRMVLLSYLTAQAAVFVTVALLLLKHAPVSTLVTAVVILGATTPPASSVVRSEWSRLVPTEDAHAAYSLDAASNSAMFVAGPPLAAILVTLHSPVIALVVAGAAKVLGDGLLVLLVPRRADHTKVTYAQENSRSESAGRARPLAIRSVRTLLVMSAFDGFAYACLFLAAVELGLDHNVTAGLLVGLLAGGEIAGGILYGSRSWPGPRWGHLVVLHATTAVVAAAALISIPLALAAGAFVCAGLVSGARDALTQTWLAQVAAASSRTEAFAWLNTFMWGGFAAGNAAASLATRTGGIHTVFLTAFIVASIAAGTAYRMRNATVTATPATHTKEPTGDAVGLQRQATFADAHRTRQLCHDTRAARSKSSPP